MAKKRSGPATQPSSALITGIHRVIDWVNENKNWVYIAIIGFCLSVTILYKISQWIRRVNNIPAFHTKTEWQIPDRSLVYTRDLLKKRGKGDVHKIDCQNSSAIPYPHA